MLTPTYALKTSLMLVYLIGYLQALPHLQRLLLCAAFWVWVKVHVTQCTLQHGVGVGPAGLRVYGFVCQYARHILEQVVLLRLPLLV
jgi:hypothetical protein